MATGDQAPRPGRMHAEAVVLVTGETGLDLVVPGRSVPELFAARIMDGSDALEIAWTEGLGPGTIAGRVAKAAELAGAAGRLNRIVGYASGELRGRIESGRFSTGPWIRSLARRLGGTWSVEVSRRPGSVPPTWDIITTRVGGSR